MSPIRSPLSRLHKGSVLIKIPHSRSSSPHPLDDDDLPTRLTPREINFEENEPRAKKVKTARMVPESKATQARMRAKWARKRASTDVYDNESVISLSSSENLIDRPLDADDSMYRGNANKSKVHSELQRSRSSPPLTRRLSTSVSNKQSSATRIPTKTLQTVKGRDLSGDVIDISTDDDHPTSTPLPNKSMRDCSKSDIVNARPRVKPRPIKKSADGDTEMPTSDIQSLDVSSIKRKRSQDFNASQYLTPPRSTLRHKMKKIVSSDEELYMDDVAWSPPRRVARRARDAFVDDEAVDDDCASSDNEDDGDLDHYDLDDDFIDDTNVNISRPNKRKNSSRGSLKPSPYIRRTGKTKNIENEANDFSLPPPSSGSSQKRKGKQRAVVDKRVASEPDDDDDLLEDADGLSPYERKEMRLALQRSRDETFSPPSNKHASTSGSNSSSVHKLVPFTGNQVRNDISPSTPAIDLASSSAPTQTATPVTPVQHANTVPVNGPQASSSVVTPTRRGFTSIADYIARTPGATAALQTQANVATVVRCKELPSACEVNDPSTHDVILQHDYASLPPLKKGSLEPYAVPQSPDYELIRFVDWVQLNRDLNADLALDFVRFVLSGNMGNPSRCSPLDVEVREMKSASRQAQIYRNGLPFVAGIQQKFIRIIMHSQEEPRFEAWLCMVFGHSSMGSQIFRNVMPFTTRSAPSRIGANAAPFDPHAPHFQINSSTFSLPYNAIVPVYDATNAIDFNVNTDLDRLAAALPRWLHGEVPRGSFVVVGYTISEYYSKSAKWTLSCNLLWIIVIAVPTTQAIDSPA
ncbi:hypothetical protein CVT24_005494 [Panaeolus cyanescens]|uniref:Uncharacterized protein n=1 Tax=Panaeolus cyanescens TaxID=181874 RepID=A0A409YC97_9AGAR|nr:hypothetical protein CVT24_005494 [Panaeolus cyanescens]